VTKATRFVVFADVLSSASESDIELSADDDDNDDDDDVDNEFGSHVSQELAQMKETAQ